MSKREQFARESRRALQRGDYAQLVRLCQASRDADPAFADAWFLESVAAEAGRNLGAAVALVDRALALRPGHPEYLVQKARYHTQVSDFDTARTAARAALEGGVEGALLLDTLGVVLTRTGDYEAAVAALRRAVAADGSRPQFHFNLAAAEQFLGNSAAATEHYEEVLRLAPGHARSYWALSELEKNAVSDRHAAAMARLADTPGLSTTDGLYLAHALARVDEQRGDYSGAIARLSAAKLRRKKELAYDFDRDAQLFAAARQFSPPAASPALPQSDPVPLFIVGLPRTGTTLVERILTAHSTVVSFGELQALPNAVKRLSGDRNPAVMSAGVLQAFATQPPSLRSAYLGALGRRDISPAEKTRYFIDKTPLNFFLVSAILEQIPEARVVILRRDARDAGLSNYRQLFSLEYSYYNYSYDLADVGRYVASFEALVEDWCARYGDRLHCVDYESLVAAPETQTRALLDYLDLPWEAGCLSFHEQAGAVATPSGLQVREPIYRGAVGRWQRYGDALQPMYQALADERSAHGASD